jgi:magnesium-transporting ATPase (P-type)
VFILPRCIRCRQAFLPLPQVGIFSSEPVIYEDDTPLPTEHQEGVAACVPGYVMANWSEEQLDQVDPLRPTTSPPPSQLLVGHTEIVFARTSPKQKLFIVEGYQVGGNALAILSRGRATWWPSPGTASTTPPP